MKIDIIDYDSSNGELGVFFYGEKILFGWEKDFGVRSYRFKIQLGSHENHIDRLLGNHFKGREKDIYETIEFIYTCDLKDFIISGNRQVLDKKMAFTELDWEKLLNVACKEEHEYAKVRLERKHSKVVREKTIFDNWSEKAAEFLEFTKESAYSWGGPFEHEGKFGCGAKVKFHPDFIKDLEKIDLFTQYSYFKLPTQARIKLEKLITNKKKFPNGDHLLYGWSQKQKREFFKSLAPEEQVETALNYFRDYSNGEYIKEMLPYKLYLYGNDDCSYTKYFGAKEEVDKELEFLRKMQPLDFNKDITSRGYYFTN